MITRCNRAAEENGKTGTMFLLFTSFFPLFLLSFVACEAGNAKEELFPCVGFDFCQCSVDFKEFSCRAAGFLDVPDNLPDAVVKL